MKQIFMTEISVGTAVQEARLLLKENREKVNMPFEIFEELLPSEAVRKSAKEGKLGNNGLDFHSSARKLIDFLDYKDIYTKGHCERVMEYALILGKALKLNDKELLNLELAAVLHDIGKLAVPDYIINKEGKLTMQEYEVIKLHPAVGYELLKDITYFDIGRSILQHHERVDGQGYPNGILAEQIDVISRIIAIADAYDAMTSSRPYRKEGLTKEQAIEQLELCRGSQFDGDIVDIFVSLLKAEDFEQ